MAVLVSNTAWPRPLVLIGLLLGVVLAATFAMWAYYGTAVFFEIVRSGWIACF
jgi:hypothetical protein